MVVGYGSNGVDLDMLIVRYLTDGSRDNTFGTNGLVVYDAGTAANELAFGVAIQNDGKIVVAGRSQIPLEDKDSILIRLNTDGSLDNSFDSDGVRIMDLTGADGADEFDGGVVINSSGKIIAAGDYLSNTLVAQFNSDGSDDTSFGTSGKSTPSFRATNDIELQPSDEKIVVVVYIECSDWCSGIVRFNVDGSVDTGYGSSGQAVGINASAAYYAQALSVQNDGKVVVAGGAEDGEWQGYLERFNTDGSRDTSFSGDGTMLLGEDNIFWIDAALTIDGNGQIITGGEYGGQMTMLRIWP